MGYSAKRARFPLILPGGDHIYKLPDRCNVNNWDNIGKYYLARLWKVFSDRERLKPGQGAEKLSIYST
jgi:hypothetical protein